MKRRFLCMARIFLLMIVSISLSIFSAQSGHIPSLQSLAANKFVRNSAYLPLIRSFDPTNSDDLATFNDLDNFPEGLYQLLKQEFFRYYGEKLYTFLVPKIELIHSVESADPLIVKPLIKSPYFIFYNQTKNILYAWDALSNQEVNKIEFPKNVVITDLCPLTATRIAYVYNNLQAIERDRLVAWDITTNTQSSEVTLDESAEKVVRINDRVVGVSSESANAQFFEFPLIYDKNPLASIDHNDNQDQQEDTSVSTIKPLLLISVPQDRVPIIHIIRMSDSKAVLVCGGGYIYTISDIYSNSAPSSYPINTHFFRPKVKRINDHAIAVVAENGRVLKVWDVNSRNQLAATNSGGGITQFFVLNEESIFIRRLNNYYLYSYQENKELARRTATLTLKTQWRGTLHLISSIYQLNSSTLLFTTYAGNLYLQSLNENKSVILKSQFQQQLSNEGDDIENLLLYSSFWYQYGTSNSSVQALYRYNWQFDQIRNVKQWVFLYIIAYAQTSNRRWSAEQKDALLKLYKESFSGDALLSEGIGSQVKWYIEHIIPEIKESEHVLVKRSRTVHEKGKEPMSEQENYEYEQEKKRQKQDVSYTSSDEE